MWPDCIGSFLKQRLPLRPTHHSNQSHLFSPEAAKRYQERHLHFVGGAFGTTRNFSGTRVVRAARGAQSGRGEINNENVSLCLRKPPLLREYKLCELREFRWILPRLSRDCFLDSTGGEPPVLRKPGLWDRAGEVSELRSGKRLQWLRFCGRSTDSYPSRRGC